MVPDGMNTLFETPPLKRNMMPAAPQVARLASSQSVSQPSLNLYKDLRLSKSPQDCGSLRLMPASLRPPCSGPTNVPHPMRSGCNLRVVQALARAPVRLDSTASTSLSPLLEASHMVRSVLPTQHSRLLLTPPSRTSPPMNMSPTTSTPTPLAARPGMVVVQRKIQPKVAVRQTETIAEMALQVVEKVSEGSSLASAETAITDMCGLEKNGVCPKISDNASLTESDEGALEPEPEDACSVVEKMHITPGGTQDSKEETITAPWMCAAEVPHEVYEEERCEADRPCAIGVKPRRSSGQGQSATSLDSPARLQVTLSGEHPSKDKPLLEDPMLPDQMRLGMQRSSSGPTQASNRPSPPGLPRPPRWSTSSEKGMRKLSRKSISSITAGGPTLQQRLSLAMMALENKMAPGAADKWKVMQIFYESIARSTARISRIDRIVTPARYTNFLDISKCDGDECEFEVGHYAPAGPSQLARLQIAGFCGDDFEEVLGLGVGVPIASLAGIAHHRARGPLNLLEQGGARCLCIVFCHAATLGVGTDVSCQGAGTGREYAVVEPCEILLTHVVWYQQTQDNHMPSSVIADGEMLAVDTHKQVAANKRVRQQKEYAKVKDELVKVALNGLRTAARGTMTTVLLPSTSDEAELVVSLYLLGGGGCRAHRAPGVAPREALGGVIVQRIENQPLYIEYTELGETDAMMAKPGERPTHWHEDIVWHGTRLKRTDGEGASLATKLQSIAEKGFDPTRCIKGAHAEGGIWVATSPLESFGHGCDGVVAFVLCLAKTRFNEWVDATSARVLRRERVLPLYSLVHA